MHLPFTQAGKVNVQQVGRSNKAKVLTLLLHYGKVGSSVFRVFLTHTKIKNITASAACQLYANITGVLQVLISR